MKKKRSDLKSRWITPKNQEKKEIKCKKKVCLWQIVQQLGSPIHSDWWRNRAGCSWLGMAGRPGVSPRRGLHRSQPLVHCFHLHLLYWTLRQMGWTNHTKEVACHLSAHGLHLVLLIFYSPFPSRSFCAVTESENCVCVHACSVASIMSNSLWPQGPWPTRFFHPRDSPGKNIGVGCHALLLGIFPTQGSNLHLLHLLHGRWILYHWATQEAPKLSLLVS